MQDFFAVWVNVTVLLMGFSSLVIMFHSRSKLSKGYIHTLYNRLFVTISLLICSSVLTIFRVLFSWETFLGGFAQYPEYVFIGATYVSLFYTSLQMLEIGKKFGFND
jgi:hypothetical protein